MAKWERKKVFINRDADYDTALERIREELQTMKVCSVVETVLGQLEGN